MTDFAGLLFILTTMIELAGFVLAFITGMVMGTIGAGGSILTSSVLVYVFSINPVLSASYTLLNVGVISVVGCAQYYKKKQVDAKTGLLFSIPALLMVFIMRRLVMPLVPAVLFTNRWFTLTKNALLMLIFAGLMIFIAWTMMRKPAPAKQPVNAPASSIAILWPGILVGILTGITGVGGGFVIVPALLFFTGLELKKAIGTSLFIITINTAIGFMGDYTSGTCYNWAFVVKLVSVTVAGMLCSGWLSARVSNERLKRIFGITILFIGCWIIIKELFLH